MNKKSNYNYQFFWLIFSLAIQILLAAGLIFLSNKNANIINTKTIDNFINEEQKKNSDESDNKLLKLAYISREIDIQAEKLIGQQNEVMRYTAKLLIVSIVAQIILFVLIVKSKRKITSVSSGAKTAR